MQYHEHKVRIQMFKVSGFVSTGEIPVQCQLQRHWSKAFELCSSVFIVLFEQNLCNILSLKKNTFNTPWTQNANYFKNRQLLLKSYVRSIRILSPRRKGGVDIDLLICSIEKSRKLLYIVFVTPIFMVIQKEHNESSLKAIDKG